MHIADLRQQLHARGARPQHVARVLRRWVQGLPQDSRHQRSADFLPKAVRQDLPALLAGWSALARLVERHPGADGSARLLVGLQDGQAVESVLLPGAGLCVSAQVGCAVGCVFCMTGRSGLLRQLGSAEIVAQLVPARTLRPVHKVVFMGMGERAAAITRFLRERGVLATLRQSAGRDVEAGCGQLRARALPVPVRGAASGDARVPAPG